MSDFREYSAAFMDHQSDLAHYGVKGMKWHHHKRQPIVGLVGKNLLEKDREDANSGDPSRTGGHNWARPEYHLKDVNQQRTNIRNLGKSYGIDKTMNEEWVKKWQNDKNNIGEKSTVAKAADLEMERRKKKIKRENELRYYDERKRGRH